LFPPTEPAKTAVPLPERFAVRPAKAGVTAVATIAVMSESEINLDSVVMSISITILQARGGSALRMTIALGIACFAIVSSKAAHVTRGYKADHLQRFAIAFGCRARVLCGREAYEK
jgi:hypothetical protein